MTDLNQVILERKVSGIDVGPYCTAFTMNCERTAHTGVGIESFTYKIPCVKYGMAQVIKEGAKARIIGWLKEESWTDGNKTLSKTVVVVDHYEAINRKAEE